MKSTAIRQKFFDFFTKRGHKRVSSSSLIPAQDPTLLFANAGMNQFKDIFLGKEKRSYTRAVSIQKCVRAGGKHSDLDNVGFTKRHLTFFEMMGNFSFGDYFKKEAIEYAWEFLTQEMALPADQLHVSVYEADDESYDIWQKQIGIPQQKIHRLGAKDNFWQMGDTGPCGPCTEIHLDRGPTYGCADEATCGPACDCERFFEIWNLVFMQYDRQLDGTDKSLKQKGVDTGMGLERLCTVVQDKDSVFEIDLFEDILKTIEKLTGHSYAKQTGEQKAAFQVLADHIRSTSLLIADGCAPSNEGRGYVLRKIIRRAALFAQKLTDKNIFPELSHTVIEVMGDIYPDLKVNKELIFKILQSETQKFATNLIRGQHILERYFEEQQASKVITGEQAFKLYDTFGFPIELVHIIAQEKRFTVDTIGFEAEMRKQQEQSGKKVVDELAHIAFDKPVSSEFTGYQELDTTSQLIALIHENQSVEHVPAGQTCWIITQKSPFFIVGGGQVPDKGWITIGRHKTQLLEVRYINNGIGVRIKTPVDLKVGDIVTSSVDPEHRIPTMKNHTATHLLQAALIQLLGKTIKQSGSLVAPDYLRFDFTYHESLSPDDIKKVENIVNEKIRDNIPLRIEYTSLKDALDRGVLAFFGDKYKPEQVRIVDVSDFSAELCGGTHVRATGDIGAFKITEVKALAAGHRRIFAVTGPKAIELFQDSFNTVKQLSHEFKVKREDVLNAINKQQEQLKELQRQIKHLKKQFISTQLPTWEQKITSINDMPFLFVSIDNLDHEELKEIANQLARKKPGLYFLMSSVDKRSLFFCSLSSEYAQRINLKEFAAWLKEQHGLRGGVRETTLQGGGDKPAADLEEKMKQWLQNHISYRRP